MENPSHPVSKKAYNANGYGAKTVYDDVFGGPSKYGVPTLSPRVEDYAEIFGSFNGSRSSSIPILELPAAGEVDLSFDFPKSRFDYSEVFGGFDGLGFATSFDELFNEAAKPAYDSSDEAWTPAESGSLSDESEPSRNGSFINEEPSQSSDSSTQFNISYNKASRRSKEDMSNGIAYASQVHAVPGFSYAVDGTVHPKKTRGGDSLPRVADDLTPNVEISKGLRETKQLRKATSHLSNNSHVDESFLSLSDINLRTRPSHLPPPSRPPPPLARAGDSDQQKSKLKASKSFAYGDTKGNSSPPFFDVEIDARSSAAVSSAAMRDAMEMAKAKLKSAKESQEKKQSLKSTREAGLGDEVGKAHKTFEGSECIKDEKLNGTGGERVKGTRKADLVSDVNEGGGNEKLAKVCAEKNRGKDYRSSRESYETEGTVAWREEAKFYEVVETDKSRKIKDDESRVNNSWVRGDGLGKNATPSFQQKEEQEDYREIEGTVRELKGNKRRVEKDRESGDNKKLDNNLKLYPEERKNKPQMTKQQNDVDQTPSSSDTNEEWEDLAYIQMKRNEVEKKVKKRTGDRKHHNAHVRDEKARRPRETLEEEEYEKRIERSNEQADIDKRLNYTLYQEEIEACERREHEKKTEVCQTGENEKMRGHAFKEEQNDGLSVSLEQKETERRLRVSVEREEVGKKHKLDHEGGQTEMRLLQDPRPREKKVGGSLQKEEIFAKQKESLKGEEIQERNGYCRREEKDEQLVEDLQQNESHESEESGISEKEESKHIEGETSSQESAECEGSQKADVEYGNESKGCSYYYDQNARDEVEGKINSTDGFCVASEGLRASDGPCEVDDSKNLHARVAACKDNENGVEVKKTKTALSFAVDRTMWDEPMGSEVQVEAVDKVNLLSEEQFTSSGMTLDEPKHSKKQVRMGEVNVSLNMQDTERDSAKVDVVKGQMPTDTNKVASNIGKPNGLTHELGVRVRTSVREAHVPSDKEDRKSKVVPSQVVKKLGEDKEKMGAHQKVSATQEPERKEKNLTPEERDKEERIKREKELEEDRLRKIEEEREREREREKDRMAIDRATLEASEKAGGEARERSSVGRITAEVRQRMMAEARERLEKASAEARERLSGDRVSTESRLRAERAAVERATAEARERAFQKAMVEKATIEARERAGNLNADKFSSAYRSGGMRQNSFSDSHDKQSQSVGPNTSSVYSSVHGGPEGESPQRCKARLERHQRTAERAAKALAEKNMRDFLAQKEQTERNRFAEYLDAEVKRWSSGKEGNLRALVSTLQYILGPESGWQPIPLTEVITSAAVKKAYRKATLCVHPDKLQQRGASIQHKYICEKVFDLLKEAWNRFNSEER